MVAALKNRKVSVGYFLFGGEQHAFRKRRTSSAPSTQNCHFYAAPVVRSGLHF
jgi:hypothetical protein